MTDIEKLKRECIDVYEANIGNDGYMFAGITSVIDHLHSQKRLLADGCVGVPREPTEAMIEAWDNWNVGEWDDDVTGYKAMIKAAQTEKREGE